MFKWLLLCNSQSALEVDRIGPALVPVAPRCRRRHGDGATGGDPDARLFQANVEHPDKEDADVEHHEDPMPHGALAFVSAAISRCDLSPDEGLPNGVAHPPDEAPGDQPVEPWQRTPHVASVVMDENF
jgi:hypothetical protein